MVGSQPIRVTKGQTFDAIPDDKYQLEILDVEAVVQMNYQSTAEEERLKYTFVVLNPDKTMKGKDPAGKDVTVNVRGRKLWARFSKNLTVPGAPKVSNLTKLVNAVYGRELAEEELNVWEPEDIIKMQVCALVDRQPDKKDPTVFWNNITSFSHADKELEALSETEKGEKKPGVKKSQPVKPAEDFEAEMDKAAADRAKA